MSEKERYLCWLETYGKHSPLDVQVRTFKESLYDEIDEIFEQLMGQRRIRHPRGGLLSLMPRVQRRENGCYHLDVGGKK